MTTLRTFRFKSGLLIFAAGYLLYILSPAGAQFILSADATATLAEHNLRWIQAAYLILVAIGYSVALTVGAYRMAFPTLKQWGLRLLWPGVDLYASKAATVDRRKASLPDTRQATH